MNSDVRRDTVADMLEIIEETSVREAVQVEEVSLATLKAIGAAANCAADCIFATLCDGPNLEEVPTINADGRTCEKFGVLCTAFACTSVDECAGS